MFRAYDLDQLIHTLRKRRRHLYAVFLVEVYFGSKFCHSLFKTVGLRVPARCIGDISAFIVCVLVKIVLVDAPQLLMLFVGTYMYLNKNSGSLNILSRVRGSVTNNNRVSIGRLDLLERPLQSVFVNYNTLGQLTICAGLRLAPFLFFFSGVGLTSPGTAATSGLLYSPR
jgi:hypothetical protein